MEKRKINIGYSLLLLAIIFGFVYLTMVTLRFLIFRMADFSIDDIAVCLIISVAIKMLLVHIRLNRRFIIGVGIIKNDGGYEHRFSRRWTIRGAVREAVSIVGAENINTITVTAFNESEWNRLCEDARKELEQKSGTGNE